MMKVYSGGLEGRWRAIIAAPSKKEAVKAISAQYGRYSLSNFHDYWSVTGNLTEVNAAMADPGQLLVVRNDYRDHSYRRWVHRNSAG